MHFRLGRRSVSQDGDFALWHLAGIGEIEVDPAIVATVRCIRNVVACLRCTPVGVVNIDRACLLPEGDARRVAKIRGVEVGNVYRTAAGVGCDTCAPPLPPSIVTLEIVEVPEVCCRLTANVSPGLALELPGILLMTEFESGGFTTWSKRKPLYRWPWLVSCRVMPSTLAFATSIRAFYLAGRACRIRG